MIHSGQKQHKQSRNTQWRKCQTLFPKCTLCLNFGKPVIMQCKLAVLSGQADC